jgi:hypothetical protein
VARAERQADTGAAAIDESRVMRLLAFFALVAALAGGASAAPPLPQRLHDTGLYVPGTMTVRAEVLSFAPQYPLWSDGTTKRRWIALPPGTAIDATRPDAWEFPRGTRLWKEFSFGRRVETRYIERLADGSWRFATYLWNAEGTDAQLVPDDGTVIAVAGAPGGRYSVPSRNDCLACHEGPAVPVLGFSALQLSPDRDPLAPHAEPARAEHVDLKRLVASGRLRNLPQQMLESPPRIAASNPTARAALGYLHGNCGHCHNEAGALAGVEMVLAQQAAAPAESSAKVLASLLGHSSRFRPHGAESAQRIAAGGGSNVLTLRMKTPNRLARMPPLSVQVVDDAGVALVERWITEITAP